VKRAHKVFAVACVDPRLASDRTVDLRQQRRRDLHKPHTAPQNSSSKAHQIADHTTAKSHDNIAALNLLVEQPFDTSGQLGPAFRRLSGGQDQRLRRDAVACKTRAQCLKMQVCDCFIADDCHARTAQQRCNMRACLAQQALPDLYVILTARQIYGDTFSH